MALLIFMTMAALAEVDAAEQKEILFRGIPWGTSYSEVEEILSDTQWLEFTGFDMWTYSTETILDNESGDGSFEYLDIDLLCAAMNPHWMVAGYKTTGVLLYFVFKPMDGGLSRDFGDTMLYGATYQFEPADVHAAAEDLVDKLSSLYGEHAGKKEHPSYAKNVKYSYRWSGFNSHVQLGVMDYEPDADYVNDSIWISYVTDSGDSWLQAASDALKEAALAEQNAVAGNGDTSGL